MDTVMQCAIRLRICSSSFGACGSPANRCVPEVLFQTIQGESSYDYKSTTCNNFKKMKMNGVRIIKVQSR